MVWIKGLQGLYFFIFRILITFRIFIFFKIVILVMVVIPSGVTAAKSQTKSQNGIFEYKPVAIEVKKNDHIFIRGFDGQVKVTSSNTGQLTLRVRQEIIAHASSILRQTLEDWNFSAQRTDRGIELYMQSPNSKELWLEILKNGGAPQFHLEISSPPLPLDMVWRRGKVELMDWSAPAKITLQEGSIAVKGGAGDLQLFGQDTEILVKSRTGRQKVETFARKIILEDLKGNITSENFSGELQLLRCEGAFELFNYKGSTLVQKGKGRLEFYSQRGPVKLEDFNGDVRGVTDASAVLGRIFNANEVRLTSQTGPINLELPQSGAYLSLASVSGFLLGPGYLQKDVVAGQKILKGRMQGSVAGSVVVRTQSGSVRIK